MSQLMHSTGVSGCQALLLAHALPLCGAANHEHQNCGGDEEEHAVDEDVQLVEILDAHQVQYLHAHTHISSVSNIFRQEAVCRHRLSQPVMESG